MSGDDTLKEKKRQAWLNSSADWASSLGPSWTGTRFLGEGNFGRVGLWELKDTDTTTPPSIQTGIRQVALKEQQKGGWLDFENEGRILELLGTIRSKHIMRMYARHTESNITRLFLEYCPGGDLTSLLEEGAKVRLPMLEADIWAVFYCLVSAAAAMDRGTEDPATPEWNRTSVVAHYDIKVQNLLMGYKDAKHRRFSAAKLGDFGEAIDEPRIRARGYQQTNRGAFSVKPPECVLDTRFPVNDAIFGTPTNIFQIGCVIHCLLTGTEKNFQFDSEYISQLSEPLKRGATQGIEMDTDAKIVNMYSEMLRTTVMECLLREPDQRPEVWRLQIKVGACLKASIQATAKVKGFKDDLNPMRGVPNISGDWISDPVVKDRDWLMVPVGKAGKETAEWT